MSAGTRLQNNCCRRYQRCWTKFPLITRRTITIKCRSNIIALSCISHQRNATMQRPGFNSTTNQDSRVAWMQRSGIRREVRQGKTTPDYVSVHRATFNREFFLGCPSKRIKFRYEQKIIQARDIHVGMRPGILRMGEIGGDQLSQRVSVFLRSASTTGLPI